ncbi:MAG: hypothetical protein ABIC57_03725 [bacterium]
MLSSLKTCQRTVSLWLKRINKKGTIRKLVTGLVLFMILISRILSNISLIQEVHASFEQDPSRVEIALPYIEDQSLVSKEYSDSQMIISKYFSERSADIVSVRERTRQVESFYNKWNSPMAVNAEFIVETADHFGIDWRLIPAISIVESSGGRINFRPYNAFGWGSQSFSSFEHSIYIVTEGLALRYGSDNPYVIAYTYCPPNALGWANKVAHLMNQM